MGRFKLDELATKVIGLTGAVAIFVVTSLFAMAAESGVLKLLGTSYDTVWALLFYMVVNAVIAVATNFCLRLVNQQLFLSGRLTAKARQKTMIAIHWLLTVLVMKIVDLAFDSVSIPPLTLVVTALLFNIVRSFVATHRLQKLLENRGEN